MYSTRPLKWHTFRALVRRSFPQARERCIPQRKLVQRSSQQALKTGRGPHS